MLNDSTNEPKFRVSDHTNGAVGGDEAHGNLLHCALDTFQKSAGSAVKDQADGIRQGVSNQLEVVVGNKPREHEPEKVAEVKQPKADSADMSKEAMAFTMNDEAKRAAAGRGQTLVFDNSIYPTSSTAAAKADEWFDSATDNKKKAA
ncbi:hypothetical protein BH11CYA1_BH11CYA1_48550 [soil metagenome]